MNLAHASSPRHAPIAIVIVGNHGQGDGIKVIEGEVKLHL